jgi:hypothetical protein
LDSLSADERRCLFAATNGHPENEAVSVLQAENDRLRNELICSHDVNHALVGGAKKAVRRAKKVEALAESSVIAAREAVERAQNKVVGYRAGPAARAHAAKDRRAIIRKMLDAGENNPRTIQRRLKEEHAIKVEPKTVQNDISILRKS